MGNENKRSFFRLQFERPLSAGIKLIGHIDDMELQNKIFKTALVDISAGGARFFTTTPLPEQYNLLVEMKFNALGKEYSPLGIIVRTILPEEGHYEYCSQFSLDETETAALSSLINNLSIKLRKTPTPSNCSFCTDEDLSEFAPLGSRTTG